MVWHPTRRPETVDQNPLAWRQQATKPGSGRPRGQPPIPPAVDPKTKLEAVKRKHSSHNETKETNMPDIPLTVVAAELGADIHSLARRLGDEVFTDEASGLKVVDAAVCRRLIGEKRARDAAIRAQAQAAKAEKAQRLDPMHARVAALKERAEQFHRDGNSPLTAIEMMCAQAKQDSLDGVPSWRMDAWLRGESYGARFTSKEQ